MSQTNIFGTDPRPHTYLILIAPPEKVIKKVRAFKQRLKELIGRDPYDLRKTAHVTILEYVRENGAADEEIIEVLKPLSLAFSPFTIKINDADYWDSGTFFLRIEDSRELQLLTASVINKVKSLKKPIRPESKLPHITISRFISQSEIDNIYSSEFDYKDDFVCDRMLVLKKVEDNPYEILVELKFEETSS